MRPATTASAVDPAGHAGDRKRERYAFRVPPYRMTVIAECAFPPDSLPLGEAVRIPRGTRVELDRVVPTDRGMLPYLWVESDDPGAFVARLREQPAVASVEMLDRQGSTTLLRARWTGSESVVRWLADSEAALLDLVGDGTGWLLRIRGEAGVVESFAAYCRERGTTFELRRLYELDEQGRGRTLGPRVTATQRETLRLAYEAGYYEEPRETTLGELAAELGVGERAVSRRLRRGVRNLLATTFGERE